MASSTDTTTLLQTLTFFPHQIIGSPTELTKNYLFLTLFIASTIFYFIIYPLYLGPYSHIPGPPLCKISWCYMAILDIFLLRNYYTAIWHRKYGPIVLTRPGDVSFADPYLMREIYGTAGRYTKSDLCENLMVYGEQPMFAAKSHEQHSKQRARIANFYQKGMMGKPLVEGVLRENVGNMIKDFDAKIDEKAERKGEKSGAAAVIDLYPLFTYFTFDNVTRFQFGPQYAATTIKSECRERQMLADIRMSQTWAPTQFNFHWFISMCSWIIVTLPQPISEFLIPRTLGQFLSGQDEITNWSWNVTERAMQDPSTIDEHTLLYRMQAFKEKENLRFSFVAAELFDIILAGLEAVAAGLVYFTFHMARHPEWQEKIRADLKALPAQVDGFPSFANIDALPVLRAFMKEVQRVNPGSSARGERIVKTGGQVFNGIPLPQGTLMTACTIALHHEPEVFPSPETFDPARWLDNSPETLKRMERNFIPFGYGARSCPGKDLGIMELKLMMAAMVLRYEIEAVPEMGDGKTGPMWQCGSMEAVPIGMRGDTMLRRIVRDE